MECQIKASQTNKKIYNVSYSRQNHIKTVKMNNIINEIIEEFGDYGTPNIIYLITREDG